MPTPPAVAPSNEFWTRGADALLSELNATAAGLSSDVAVARLAREGRNVVAEAPRRRILARIGKRLTDPLIAILIVAAIVSAAIGDLASGGIILVILTASIALEVSQEHGAQKAVDALKHSVAVRAAVRRGGEIKETPVEDIVPCD